MTDTLTTQLLEASFRGVPFRVRSEGKSEAGRKIILHDYVNSSDRFVEDQGELPPRFRITAFVHGENFKQLADALEGALKQKGAGRLVLPTLGAFSVYAMPYSVDASQTSVGEISFSLDFAVGRPAAGPSFSLQDATQVFGLGDDARQAVQNALGDLWQIPSTFENATVAISDFTGSIDDVVEKYSSLIPVDDLSALLSKAQRLKATASQIVRDPSSLAFELIGGTPRSVGIWQRISLGLGNTASGFSELIQSMSFGGSDFSGISGINGDSQSNNPIQSGGSTIPLWQETTAQRTRRNDNRLNIVNAQRVSALVGAYEVAANTDFQTQDQISDVRRQLEDEHERIMLDGTVDKDIIQSDPDVRTSVEAVRIASLNVLEQKRQEAFFVTTKENKKPYSSFVEAYRLYAEEFTDSGQLEDRAIQLRALNPSKPAMGLDGGITIFRTT